MHNTPLSPEKLTAAMMTTEDGVELPTKVRVHSVVGNLIALAPNDVFTLSQEIPGDTTGSQLQRDANALKSKIRASINSSIRHAMKHHGQRFSMESAVIIYPSGRIFIQCVVTCVAPGQEGDAE